MCAIPKQSQKISGGLTVGKNFFQFFTFLEIKTSLCWKWTSEMIGSSSVTSVPFPGKHLFIFDTLHIDCWTSTLRWVATMTAHGSLPIETSIQHPARPWKDWRVVGSAGGGQGLHLWPRSVTWLGLQGQIEGRRQQISQIHKLSHCFGLNSTFYLEQENTSLSANAQVNVDIWFISALSSVNQKISSHILPYQ